jgi:hypothetical protein
MFLVRIKVLKDVFPPCSVTVRLNVLNLTLENVAALQDCYMQ